MKVIKCENTCPLGKFEGCCHCCPIEKTCEEACEEAADACGQATFDEETGLAVFQSSELATLQKIAAVVQMKKQIEDQEKALKTQLQTAMEKFGIKKFESDILNLTYVAPTTATSVDSPKLKKKYPDIFTECSKSSAKAGYVKITLKDGESPE
ncbi:MAG: hypothetical protein PHX61_08075 [Alphaproteobacteria bacterium]|nr:hypothetical protein [Alphaproteobacteria bacterium]